MESAHSLVVGRKYRLLQFPSWQNDTDLVTVKVKGIYTNELRGEIVEYVYNWPFPITKQVTMREFRRRMVVRSQ